MYSKVIKLIIKYLKNTSIFHNNIILSNLLLFLGKTCWFISLYYNMSLNLFFTATDIKKNIIFFDKKRKKIWQNNITENLTKGLIAKKKSAGFNVRQKMQVLIPKYGITRALHGFDWNNACNEFINVKIKSVISIIIYNSMIHNIFLSNNL